MKQNQNFKYHYDQEILDNDITQSINSLSQLFYKPSILPSKFYNQSCPKLESFLGDSDLYSHLEKTHNKWPCKGCG